MNADAVWQEQNAAFLQNLVAQIRARLQAIAGHEKPPAMAWLEAAPVPQPPALLLLRDIFGLTGFETAVLALCAVYELDMDIGQLCGRASDPARPWPSFGLALQAFDSSAWEAVAADGPLRAWQLLALERRGGEPLAMAALRCDERILDFIKGLNRMDERLAVLVAELPATDPGADLEALGMLTQLWHETNQPRAVLFGASTATRAALAAQAAAADGLRLVRMEVESLPSGPGELDGFARLWNREAALRPLALLLEMPGREDEALASLTTRFIRRLVFPLALSADIASPRLAELALAIPVKRPDADLQETAWQAALGPERAALAHRLAGAFDLAPAAIAQLGSLSPQQDDAALWQRCVASVRPRLDSLAQRIEPRAIWEDMVLPAEQQAMLLQIVDQVRHRQMVYNDWGYASRLSRGLGINALFTGESGTGKTMAAEVLAGTLGLNLYRIDLSSVVSKYIGETEKNLRQLFDAAEQGGVVLFFDEADALFGKRSEVKDSHDRYANIEVNYLLQRIESFSGLAILATNMKAALDTAFLRRMRFVVRFPHPGPAERQLMWRRAFPKTVPLGGLDYERLGRINLTGGHIIAASLNAAFLAAATGQKVGMAQVLAAAKAELVKLNRPISEAEFAVPAAILRAAE